MSAVTQDPPTTTNPGAEVPLTLDLETQPPKPLGYWDQAALWGSFGITLTIPVAAAFVLAPLPDVSPLSIAAAVTAIIAGVVAGSALLAASAVPGAQTGAPAMAVLRGLLGRRTSYLPTVLNLIQCVGWSAVEILVIASVGASLTSQSLKGVWAIVAGVVAIVMAIWPLGFVTVLRKYLIWLVIAATIVLLVGVFTKDAASSPQGTWSAFWPAFDIVVALPVSWAPLAADYSRHSRSGKTSFWAVFTGYSVTAIAYFMLGLFALLTISGTANAFTATTFVPALVALPIGTLALAVLLIGEVDKVFANIYSTAMSTQNIAPKVDRRILAIVVGVVSTVLALAFNLEQYESFLFLIGAVFVPLTVVLVVDWFVVRRIVGGRAGAGFNPARPGPHRWVYLIAWAAGFVAYNLVNPGLVSWWASWWTHIRDAIGFVPPLWMSASITSAVIAALVTVILGPLSLRNMSR